MSENKCFLKFAQIQIGGDVKYVVYLDVFFFVNFFMDFIILRIYTHIFEPQTTGFRCVAAGLTGSFLACISLLIPYERVVFRLLYAYVFIAVILNLIVCRKKTIKKIVKGVVIIYGITIFMGGAVNLLYSYTYLGFFLKNYINILMAGPVNIFRLITYTGVSYMMLTCIWKIIMKNKRKYEYVDVVLKLNDKSICLKGLIDTGNSLKDPYTGARVHVVQAGRLNKIISREQMVSLHYRLVPFNSLGNSNGIIEVINMDSMTVEKKDSMGNIVAEYTENNPAVGLYSGKFTKTDEYEILLGGEINNYIETKEINHK